MVNSRCSIQKISHSRKKSRRSLTSLEEGFSGATKTPPSVDLEEPPPSEACRVCLNDGQIPIYNEHSSDDLSSALKTFADIDVTPDDNLPHSLCYDCNTLLQGAVTLRKTALRSDQYLRNANSKERFTTALNVNISVDHGLGHTVQGNRNNSNYLENLEDGDPNNIDSDSDQETNEDKKTYPCVLCSVTFEKKRHLILHRRTSEHQNAIYKCPICQKEYGLRSYKDHIERHNSTNKKQCDICGKLVPGNHLKRHRIIHTQEFPYKCQVCPYKGRCRDALKGHMRSHSGDKPFLCPVCPVRCTKKFNLQQHMLTHKQEFDYQCDSCGKGYHTKKELELHVKVGHAGVKDHVCSLCSKAFGYRKQLMQHQRNVHKRTKLPSGRTPLYLLLEGKAKPDDNSNANT